MDPNDFGWLSNPFLDALWLLLSRAGWWLSDLQARYPQVFSPQTLFGLLGTTIAIWRWWEGREANLFRKFEGMIAREEAQLIKARNDLIDVMVRPGPGLLIRRPLFVEGDLLRVLARRKWSPRSLFPLRQKRLDGRLEQATKISESKVAAHLQRLSLFRAEIASARLIQGAVAAGRAAHENMLFKRQALDLEAFDRFREVLALPGHREDTTALELVAHQLARMEDGDDQRTVDAYQRLVGVLLRQEETYARNLALARGKRGLAVLRYPNAPARANAELGDAISWLMRLGPPRDRDLLELAETVYLSGLVKLRLGAVVQGPRDLRLAQTYYRNLLRGLRSRRRGLFRWMYESAGFSGHRTAELIQRADHGLAQTTFLLRLFQKRPRLLVRGLQRGHGVRRRNRKPPPPPKDR